MSREFALVFEDYYSKYNTQGIKIYAVQDVLWYDRQYYIAERGEDVILMIRGGGDKINIRCGSITHAIEVANKHNREYMNNILESLDKEFKSCLMSSI